LGYPVERRAACADATTQLEEQRLSEKVENLVRIGSNEHRAKVIVVAVHHRA